MKRWMTIGLVIALMMLTAIPVMAERGAGQGGDDRAGQHEERGEPERNQGENHDADAPNGDQQHDRDRDRDRDAAQDQVRAQEGKNEDAPEQNRNGDGPVNTDPARVRVEARNRFELHGEIVAIDPVARTLTLRVRNADGQVEMIRMQLQAGMLVQQRNGTGTAAVKAGQTITVRGTIHEETWTASHIRLSSGR